MLFIYFIFFTNYVYSFVVESQTQFIQKGILVLFRIGLRFNLFLLISSNLQLFTMNKNHDMEQSIMSCIR